MNNEKWLKAYRTNKDAVWIKCRLTNGEEHFHAHHVGWMVIRDLCHAKNVFVEELYLQFRTHEVEIDVKDAEAIYLIRSVMGQMGNKTHQYYTTGRLEGGKMHKQMWLIPELIVEKELSDELDECFEEAIIYNEEAKKNRQE